MNPVLEDMEYFFSIGTFNRCNLKCPSCPAAEIASQTSPAKMTPQFMGKLLEKAVAECKVALVSPFVITDPLIHPEIVEMVRTIDSFGLKSYLSTNLNHMGPIEQVLTTKQLTKIAVSVSGFTQETYGQTHLGGNIEKVKVNMIRLARARDRINPTLPLELIFHRYIDNLQDERSMRQYAEALGFEFRPIWASSLKHNVVLSFAENDCKSTLLPEVDRKLFDKLAFPIDKMIAICKQHNEKSCHILDHVITIDEAGQVMHCSGPIGDFLSTPLSEIQARRRQSDICRRCAGEGIHNFVSATCAHSPVPGVDELIMSTIRSHYRSKGLDIYELIPDLRTDMFAAGGVARESHTIWSQLQ